MNSFSRNLLVYLYYCVCIIICDLCVWYSKFSELSLFSLKFIDTWISTFHICINISDLVLRVWVMERIYPKPSVIISLPEIYWYVCNCIRYIHTYQCFSGCLSESDFDKNISSSFMLKLLIVLRCMTAHLEIKRIRINFSDIK